MDEDERNFDEELQPYLDEALDTLRDPNAQELDVRRYLFGEKQLAAIAEALPNSNIRILRVGREHANDTALAPLIDALPKSRVTKLEFYGTRMREETLGRLTEVLPHMALEELRVDAYYREESDSLCDLMAALPPSIRKLGFACQNFSNKDASALAQVMRNRPLEAVDVSRSIMGEEGTAQIIREVRGSRLQSLKLTHAAMTDTNIALLVEALPDSAVEELRLWSCELSAQGAQQLAAGLTQSRVKTLDVGSNKGIGKEGTIAIAQALPQTEINDLRIDQCRSEREGFKALARALPHSKLESLGLFLSGVDSEAAQALAAAIPQSPLRILGISSNSIGNTGARALAEALSSSGLQYLDLWRCGITDDGFKALAEALPKSQLAYLNVKENDVGVAGQQALAGAIPESQLVWLDIYGHKDPAINEQVQTGFRAARANYNAIFRLAVKLTTQPENMSADEWEHAAARTGALHFAVRQEWRMPNGDILSAKETTDLLVASFLQVRDTHPKACQVAIVNLLPYAEAKECLGQVGIKLEAGNLLDNKGHVPKDRNICRGGAKALFSDVEAWQNTRQVKQAHASLPEAQKALITNLHQLTATVGTMQRQRLMSQITH